MFIHVRFVLFLVLICLLRVLGVWITCLPSMGFMSFWAEIVFVFSFCWLLRQGVSYTAMQTTAGLAVTVGGDGFRGGRGSRPDATP